MDKTLKARVLVRGLTPAELDALRIIAAGGSIRDLARSLSTDDASAAEIIKSMKLKLSALRDADVVRLAIYAGICD